MVVPVYIAWLRLHHDGRIPRAYFWSGALTSPKNRPDNQGRLPLHVVVLNATADELFNSTDTVECLLNAYPDGVDIGDNEGRSPLDIAQKRNLMHLVSVMRGHSHSET